MLFSSFHFLRTGKKGQLASLLTVILVALFIFIFISVDLGKFGLNRTRVSNAADSAALAAGSVASQLLNYMASYNDLMLMNFAGFVSQSTLLLVAWIIDLVKTIRAVIEVISHIHDQNVYEYIFKAAAAVGCLVLDSLCIVLTIDGTTKVGRKLKDKIYELNAKLPENTRNVLRQYAFSSAGIDEPKIEYNKWLAGGEDSESAWKDYLNLETGFSAFMRTLSQTNDADPNYGPNNLLSYSWQDERRGQAVSNLVEVYSTPVQKLSFDDIDFEDVAKSDSIRGALLQAIYDNDVSWWLESWLTLTMTLSPLLYASLEMITNFVKLLNTLMAVFLIISGIWLIIEIILCCLWCCESECEYIAPAAACVIFFALYVITVGNIDVPDPKDIPVLEYGRDSNDLTVGVEVRRTTAKAGGGAMDYGTWIMQYPEIVVQSKAEIIGSGGKKLFPPLQDYSPQLSFIK
ncbi:MAG: hypothetical protein KKA59_08205 [Candidatus Omnitrophica bacterium]|nr:hypothetical protein [Candidatus Omnitrophota bacterium]